MKRGKEEGKGRGKKGVYGIEDGDAGDIGAEIVQYFGDLDVCTLEGVKKLVSQAVEVLDIRGSECRASRCGFIGRPPGGWRPVACNAFFESGSP